MFENECVYFQRAVAGINAHDSSLVALDFNPAGTKLATASTTVSHTSSPPNRSSHNRELLLECLVFPRERNYLNSVEE